VPCPPSCYVADPFLNQACKSDVPRLLETTDDEEVDSFKSSGSGERPTTATTGNVSFGAQAMNALSDAINSLFGALHDPKPSSCQERVEEPDKNSGNPTEGGTEERYKGDSSERLEKRVERLTARYSKTPPGPMKETIPVLIRDIEAELDRRRG
jgi:hypothetical protein